MGYPSKRAVSDKRRSVHSSRSQILVDAMIPADGIVLNNDVDRRPGKVVPHTYEGIARALPGSANGGLSG